MGMHCEDAFGHVSARPYIPPRLFGARTPTRWYREERDRPREWTPLQNDAKDRAKQEPLDEEKQEHAIHDATEQERRCLEASARREQAWLEAAAKVFPWQMTSKFSFLQVHTCDEFESLGAARRTCSAPPRSSFEAVWDKDCDMAETESGDLSSRGSSSCGGAVGESSIGAFFSGSTSASSNQMPAHTGTKRLCKSKRYRLRRWVERTKELIQANPRAFDVESIRASLGDRGGKHDSAAIEIINFHERAMLARSKLVAV
jgi:hypothetical protein